jgi:hypothetical protein
MPPVFLILIVIAVISIAVFFSWLAQKKRREELGALAQELGWSFDPSSDASHDEQFAQFEIFSRGHSRSAYNTLTGRMRLLEANCPVTMGDFRYKVTSGSGKNRRTHTYRFSYVVAQLPFHIPELIIRPEGVFDKLLGAFGFDDIDYESVEFSNRFYVKSSNKRFAYDVIDPRMMEFLLRSRPPMVGLEHDACFVSDGRSRWTAAHFKSTLAWLETFFQQWPRHVVDDVRRYAASP